MKTRTFELRPEADALVWSAAEENPMSTRPHSRTLLLAAGAILLAACDSRPKLDVKTAGTPAAPAPAAAPASTASLPPSHPPVDAPAGPPRPVVAPGGQGSAALAWNAPKGWRAEPPANEMRRAQYRVPGAGGEGECVVFYFGPGQGGDPASNVDRWAAQFEHPDGKNSMPARIRTINGLRVLAVETTGTYLAGGMTGGAVEKKAGWALLGAVVQGPDSNWFFKFTGPKATVEAQRAAFEAMLSSLRPGA
jgi:hypothetical protein